MIMSLDLFTFIIFYFIIINSTVGYGYLAAHITKVDLKFFNYSFLGLLGVFILVIVSYTSHLFFKHSYIHNSIILIIGILSFVNFFLREKKKINLIKLNIFFLLLFIAFIIFKSHDDFSYYHFPYTYYLTQSEIAFGIGNFNHGFRTPSSIFYLNSIFYLPIIKYNFFQIGVILIMGFSSYQFFYLVKQKLKKKKYDKFFFLSLFFFMFTLIFFYRIAEHGTDRSAQILIFLLIIELLIIINFDKGIKERIIKILIILGLVISLKSFYVLYLAFSFPVFYYFIKEKKLTNILLIFKSYYFYLFLLLFGNILFVNFANSGCLIYPVSITCFDYFSWSIPLQEVSAMNDWYEQWSKAGANPNFRVENPQEYIQHFNWVNNWFHEYFFTKVSDFIFGILFLTVIFLLIFRSKERNSFSNYKGEKFIYIILLILLFEWFYNHPSLRYGGYQLLCLLLFLPVSNFLSSKKHFKNVLFKTNILLIIGITIFFGRNINRLINENIKYDFNPFVSPAYRITEDHFSVHNRFKDIVNNKLFCKTYQNKCTNNIDVKQKYGYKIFFRKSI
jgi:hypothetical protein